MTLTLEAEGLSVRYDTEAGAAYIRLRAGKVAKTLEERPASVMLDFDAKGHLVGVELLDPHAADGALLRRIAKRYDSPALGRLRPEHLPKLFSAS